MNRKLGKQTMAKVTRQKISPFLWFENKAEEAARFYTSIFKNSRILSITRYNETGSKVSGRPHGSVMTVAFQIEGQNFTALNGGPVFKFSPATSFAVSCDNQREIDNLWKKLSKGERLASADGSMTSTALRGRSSPPSCPRCSKTETRRKWRE